MLENDMKLYEITYTVLIRSWSDKLQSQDRERAERAEMYAWELRAALTTYAAFGWFPASLQFLLP